MTVLEQLEKLQTEIDDLHARELEFVDALIAAQSVADKQALLKLWHVHDMQLAMLEEQKKVLRRSGQHRLPCSVLPPFALFVSPLLLYLMKCQSSQTSVSYILAVKFSWAAAWKTQNLICKAKSTNLSLKSLETVLRSAYRKGLPDQLHCVEPYWTAIF